MQAVFISPLGFIRLTEKNEALTFLTFEQHASPLSPETPLLREAVRQLNAYFSGTLKDFSLPLAPQGTHFQMRVWEGLCRIPYGNTISYSNLAEMIGYPGACRAVGNANGKNPLPILIPCHRVIAANGSLGGYSAGSGIKERLLFLEGISPWKENDHFRMPE